MTAVITKPDTEQKLDILSTDARYDLACACGTRSPAEHRRRGPHGRWIYPVTLPNGGTSLLFKTLLSNACTNDCRYCPLRRQSDVPRCTLGIDETARTFLDYRRRGERFGLLLSSAASASGYSKAPGTSSTIATQRHIPRSRHERGCPAIPPDAQIVGMFLNGKTSCNPLLHMPDANGRHARRQNAAHASERKLPPPPASAPPVNKVNPVKTSAKTSTSATRRPS